MDHDDRQPEADITYHFLHSTPEELAQLPPEELLQAALEERTLLQIIVGILNAPDKDPVLRIVAADLVYTQARLAAENQEAEAAAPMTYDIKRVSLRLGLSPTQVRTAYEQPGREQRDPHSRPPVPSQEGAAAPPAARGASHRGPLRKCSKQIVSDYMKYPPHLELE